MTKSSREFFKRLDEEKSATIDATYLSKLTEARKAAQSVRNIMFLLHRDIEAFDRDDNIKLNFLNDRKLEEKKEFIKRQLDIMQYLYDQCDEVLRHIMSAEYFDAKLESLYGKQLNYSDDEKGEAYKHIAVNLNLLLPIITKMKDALNDPANASKLKEFEDSLLSRTNPDPTITRADRAAARRARQVRNAIIGYSILLVAITIAAVAIITVAAIFAPPLIIVAVAGVVGAGYIFGLSACVDRLMFYSKKQYALQSVIPPARPPAIKSVDKEAIFSFSEKVKNIIHRIHQHVTQPSLSSSPSLEVKHDNAYFDKHRKLGKTDKQADKIKKPKSEVTKEIDRGRKKNRLPIRFSVMNLEELVMTKAHDDLKENHSLTKEPNLFFRQFFDTLSQEKNQTIADAAYAVVLAEARKAAVNLQASMLIFHNNIQKFNGEQNSKLKFLDDMDEKKKLQFMKYYLTIMQDFYLACEKTLRHLMSPEFIDESLKELFGEKPSYTDRQRKAAYTQVGENLKLLVPIFEKMNKALSEPSSVAKLEDFEKSLLSHTDTNEDDVADAARTTRERIRRRRNAIIGYSVGIAVVTLAVIAIITPIAIFAPPLLIGLGALVGLVYFIGVFGMGGGINSNVTKINRLSNTESIHSTNTETVLSLSDKLRGLIQKIRHQFKKPGSSTHKLSPPQQENKAFFDKKRSKSSEVSSEESSDLSDESTSEETVHRHKKEPPQY